MTALAHAPVPTDEETSFQAGSTLFSEPSGDDRAEHDTAPAGRPLPPSPPPSPHELDTAGFLRPRGPGLPLPPWPMTSVPSARSTSPSGAST